MENIELDIDKIHELVNQKKDLEAIKFICKEHNVDLITAKKIVAIFVSGKLENLANINFSNNKRERCRVTKSENEITVTYYDLNGVETKVTPSDPLWNRVKILMKNDEILQEYEDSFFLKTKLVSKKINFIEYEKEKNWQLYVIATILILGVCLFYYKFR